MANTFELKSSSFDGRYMVLTCTQTPNDSVSNSSVIDWTLTTMGGDSLYYSTGPTKVIINGKTVYSKSRVAWDSYVFPAKKGSVSGSLTVTHDDDGDKDITVSFSTAIYTGTVSTYSDTWTLDSIPRYATVSHSLKSKTETEITVHWSSDNTVDYIWYSTDNGSNWTGVNVADGTSGTYTISGLSADTTYKVKTRIRRKDSQLTTDSSALSVTTYNYPHCTSSPDFVLGDSVTLKFYNPLNREFNFYIIGNGTQIDVEYSCDDTSYTGLTSTNTTVPYLYDTIPNDTSGKYKVKVVYDGSTITRNNGNTYSIDESVCKPSFDGFTYADYGLSNITGNDQILIKGASMLRVTIPSANKMVVVNGATPKYYIASIDGQSSKANFTDDDTTINLGNVNSVGVKRLSVRAYDSRGLSAVVHKDVTVIEYEIPEINVDLARLNNFEEQTTLKISGTYSRLTIDSEDKNTIDEVSYCYRETDGEWSEETPVTFTADAGTYTCDDVILTLDRDKSYEFYIHMRDLVDENEVYKTVDVGKAVFMISSNKKTCYIYGVEVPTFENVYPIGSVYCSSTNTNPSEIYGGTWKLIDKGFETASTEVTQEATEYLSNFVVASIRTERTVRFRLQLTTAKDIDDTSVTLGTIDLESHGLSANNGSYFLYGIFGDVAMSDGGNSTITYDFNNTGVLEVNDCLNIDGTHVLPAGSSFYINAVVITSQSRMNDEFCDKFYWQRTA